jgi:hypothetical protein
MSTTPSPQRTCSLPFDPRPCFCQNIISLLQRLVSSTVPLGTSALSLIPLDPLLFAFTRTALDSSSPIVKRVLVPETTESCAIERQIDRDQATNRTPTGLINSPLNLPLDNLRTRLVSPVISYTTPTSDKSSKSDGWARQAHSLVLYNSESSD